MAARKRSRLTWRRRLFAWSCAVVGGALNGAGLFLWAQLSGIRYAREQHDDLNFFERFLGKLTFLWRSLDEKLVLAIGDIPESYLIRCELLANTFAIVGLIVLALPLFVKPRRRIRAQKFETQLERRYR